MEDVITSPQQVPSEKTIQALREQLNQDTRILGSLDPNSDTYHRLAAHVEHQTDQLLDYQDQRDQQREATRRAMIEHYHRDQEASTRMGAAVVLLIGIGITCVGWGTWWLVLGIFLILGGGSLLFMKDI